MKDFLATLQTSSHFQSEIAKLRHDVEEYAKQFPTIGFEKETMKYKNWERDRRMHGESMLEPIFFTKDCIFLSICGDILKSLRLEGLCEWEHTPFSWLLSFLFLAVAFWPAIVTSSKYHFQVCKPIAAFLLNELLQTCDPSFRLRVLDL